MSRPTKPASTPTHPERTAQPQPSQPAARQRQPEFERLVDIMHRLRSPGGCPWDAEQTHDSLRPYLVEEAYEVLEALDAGSDRELCEELGDLLLQVVFHAELAAERQAFTIEDVLRTICDKLVRRHPHVFGEVVVASTAEVLENWSRIKAAEKATRADAGTQEPAASVLDGIPAAMPALLRAHRMGEKASGAGFDWPSAAEVRSKVAEELAEVDEAIASSDPDALARELGDLLFAVTSYVRLLGQNAETVLHRGLGRFRRRFTAMEARLAAESKDIHDVSSAELEDAWEAVKRSSAD